MQTDAVLRAEIHLFLARNQHQIAKNLLKIRWQSRRGGPEGDDGEGPFDLEDSRRRRPG